MPDITSLSKDVRKFEFKRNDESERVTFEFDLDALTESYYRGVGERQAARLRANPVPIQNLEELAKLPPEEADKPFDNEKAAEWVQEFFARAADSIGEEKALRADMLSHGPLVSWDVTNGGELLPCTEEILLKHLSLTALNEIWEFYLDKTRTVRNKNNGEEVSEKGSGSFSRGK